MIRILRKPLAIVLILLLAVGSLPGSIFGITASAATTDSDGYVRITTAQELDTLVRNGLTGKYRLYADIDLSNYAYNSSSWTSKNGWNGIGAFKGTFDGNGYTIKGLWSKDRGGNQGLFTKLSGATVKNLTIQLASAGITGSGERKGALSGNVYDGSVVDNVHVYGAAGGSPIQGSANYIAGLAGVVYKSTVKNASVHNVQLSGYSYVAGLAGVIYYQSNVSESYVENATVYASASYAGGFAGAIYDKSPVVTYCAVFDSSVTAKSSVAGGFTAIAYDTAQLTRCYVDGIAVKAHSYAGGFAGQIHGTATVSISCAQNGTAQTTGTYIAGGFVGEFAYWGSISNCYAQIDVTTKTSGAGSFVGYYSNTGNGKYINNTYGAGTVNAGSSLHYGAYAGFTGSHYSPFTGTNYYDSTLTAGLPASGTSNHSDLPKGYDTATMKKQATFVGWDFDTIWRIDEHITYPYFLWTGNMFGITPEISKTSGNVTSTDGLTRINDILEYTVTAQNNGSIASWNNVDMIDVLPAGVTYVAGSAKVDGVAVSASYLDSSRTLTVSLGNLAPSVKKVVTFQVSVNDDAYGMTIQNSATLTGKNSRTGATVEKTVTDSSSYTVYAKSAAPVFNPVAVGDTTVSGTGIPGAQVTVIFAGSLTVDATVSAGGEWTVSVPSAVTLVANNVLNATQTEPGKAISDLAFVVISAKPQSAAPVIHPVAEGDLTVSGTGVSDAQVPVVFPDDSTADTTVSAGGEWTVSVPSAVTLVEGNTVTATQTEADKMASKPVSTVVTANSKSAAPVVYPITAGDRNVSGTGVPSAHIMVAFPGGATVNASVSAGGQWTVTVPAAVTLAAGNTVIATQTEAGKTVSDPASVVVTAKPKSAAPVIITVIEGDRDISGTGVAQSTIVVTLPGGETVTTTVADNGLWSIGVPIGTDLITGDKVSAVQTEVDKEVSDPATVTVYAKNSGSLEPGEVSADKQVVSVDDETFEITLSVAGRSFETEERITPQVDVILMIDVSGSMRYAWNADGASTEPSRIELTKEAAKNAVDKIMEANPKNRVGIITFSEFGGLAQKLSSNASQVKAAIDTMEAIGATNMQNGLLLVENEFNTRTDKTATPTVVVISDGLPTLYHPSLTDHSEENQMGNGAQTSWYEVQWSLDQMVQMKASTGAEIYTIGFGPASDVMERMLKPDPTNMYSFDGYHWEKRYTYSYMGGQYIKGTPIDQQNPLYPASTYNYWVPTPYQSLEQQPTGITNGLYYSAPTNFNYMADTTYRGSNVIVSGEPENTPMTLVNHWDPKYAYWEPESKVAGTDTDAEFLNRTLQEIIQVIINSPIKGDATVTDVIGEGFALVDGPAVDVGSLSVNGATIVWTIPAEDFPINVDGTAAVACTFTVRLTTTESGEYWTNKQRDGYGFYNKIEFTPSDKNSYYPSGPQVVEIVGGEKVTIAYLTRTVVGLVMPLVVSDAGLGEDFLRAHDVIVELRPSYSTPAEPGLSVTAELADSSGLGGFTFENVPFGTYVLHISRPGYLTRCMAVTISESSPATVFLSPPDSSIFELWAGDVDESINVDGSDTMIILARIGVRYGEPTYLTSADLNGDGIISIMDYAMAQAKMNQSIFNYSGTDDVNWD